MKSNSAVATTLVLAGIILAALSALAGLLKKSIAGRDPLHCGNHSRWNSQIGSD